MNKLTKVGCSALCGSLAAISAANAGDLTVTGGVDMSWISLSDQVTGNPIGMGSNLTFKGNGELDNGWTFDLSVAHANKNAYSAAVANITMGGLGKLTVNQGDSSAGIQAFDDKMPTAWEEPWGAGLSTGIVLVSGIGKSMAVQYATPTMAGITLTAATAEMGQVDTGDKGSGGVKASALGRGYDATININPTLGTEILSGLNFFVGGHYAESYTALENNQYEGVAGITFAIGPVELGYGRQGHWTGKTTTNTDTDFYRNSHYGVAVNITDNLSASYGWHKSRRHQVNPGKAGQVDSTEVASLQIAYTMGGASMRIARMEGDNLLYSQNNDKNATVLSMALAF